MKKKMTVLSMLLVVCACVSLLTGCVIDDEHASISIITSNGWASTWASYNGKGVSGSGLEIAMEDKHKLHYTIPEGETLTYTFKCFQCGNEQIEELTPPASKTLACECKEEIREYFCLEVVYPQPEAEKAENKK